MFVEPPHPATIKDFALLKQCEVTFGRGTGPGGQHRNKVETEVTLLHIPTGITARAAERRKQGENRRNAVRRLRLKLARKVRTEVHRSNYRPSALWQERRQGKQIAINPKHTDYPALLAEALDLIVARDFDVAGAAGVLGVSMSQLAKLLRHERHALVVVNEGRTARGLAALK